MFKFKFEIHERLGPELTESQYNIEIRILRDYMKTNAPEKVRTPHNPFLLAGLL